MSKLLQRAGISIAVVALLALHFLAGEAGARPGGFGGGGAPARSFSAPRMGGHSFSAPRLGGSSIGARSVGRLSGSTLRGAAARHSGVRFTGSSGHRFATATALSHPARLSGHNGAWSHRSITNAAFRASFVRQRTFTGRFHGFYRRPWWIGGIVVGWVGPVFWPYAYDDFFDYVFWPYAYDDFWPYAYEDVYYGIYGSYGYVDPALKSAARRTAPAATEQRAAGVCGESSPELTNWPVERISEVIEPNEAQRATLNELKDATARSIDILRAACPNELPSVPTGRLAAMESRLQVMLEAVHSVRSPLDRLYQSLNDEQKARFNAVAPGSAVDKKEQRDLARLCTHGRTGVAGLPIDRVAQAVQPTEEQRSSFADLKAAAAKASEQLKSNCPTYDALTPTGRVEAMEKRLEAVLDATKIVQPSLTSFYNALSDEQKARFNSLGAARHGA